MSLAPAVLFCFAVREEARPFQRLSAANPRARVLVTGMGARNAERVCRQTLAGSAPTLVVTSGFAGGLRPDWKSGTVVFDEPVATSVSEVLLAAGAQRARFCSSDRVVTTAAEKRRLREATGADVVEMESQAISAVCQEMNLPYVIVRVILDTAEEDLALDFNQLVTPDSRLDGRKLALTLLKAPGKIGALLRLQRQSRITATKLAEALLGLVKGG